MVEYTTTPSIHIDQLLEIRDVEIREPKVPRFERHKQLYRNGQYIHVQISVIGYCRLIRTGYNNIHEIFPLIIEQYGVVITDEYGLDYPNCME